MAGNTIGCTSNWDTLIIWCVSFLNRKTIDTRVIYYKSALLTQFPREGYNTVHHIDKTDLL